VATVGILLLGLTFGGLVLAVETGESSRVFHSRALQFFGKYSYGLYVFHQLLCPVFLTWNFKPWFRSTTVSMLVWLATITLSSIALSLVSWHLFEKRVLSLKRYLQYDDSTKTERKKVHERMAVICSGEGDGTEDGTKQIIELR
jgi:peptidoglycan/LPS O-acetylase OafA/YrhL